MAMTINLFSSRDTSLCTENSQKRIKLLLGAPVDVPVSGIDESFKETQFFLIIPDFVA